MPKKTKQSKRVAVSRRAVIQRVRRRLAHDAQTLFTNRSACPMVHAQIGDLYVVDQNNHIADTHIELEKYARDLGVLADWEAMAAE